MKSLRKVTSLFLVVVMLAGMIAMQGTTVQSAKGMSGLSQSQGRKKDVQMDRLLI